MLNRHVSPEIGALMKSCEELFSRLITDGELTRLDREILEYYAAEIRKHLDIADVVQEPSHDDGKSLVGPSRPRTLSK